MTDAKIVIEDEIVSVRTTEMKGWSEKGNARYVTVSFKYKTDSFFDCCEYENLIDHVGKLTRIVAESKDNSYYKIISIE